MCKENLFEAINFCKLCSVNLRKIQRKRENEILKTQNLFTEISNFLEERKDFIFKNIQKIYRASESENLEILRNARKKITKMTEICENLKKFLKNNDIFLSQFSSFNGDDKEKIVELNEQSAELFKSIEREQAELAKQNFSSQLKNTEIFPEIEFEYQNLLEKISKFGYIENVENSLFQFIQSNYVQRIEKIISKEAKIMFFKNIDGQNMVLGYNKIQNSLEKYGSINNNSNQNFHDLMVATSLKFGDISLTGGTKKGAITGEKTFYIWQPDNKILIMPNMFNKRYFHAAVEINGELYVLGGSNSSGRMNSCEKINYLNNIQSEILHENIKWENIASLNITRSKLQACVFDYKTIYVFGGEQFSSIEKYNTNSNEWELFPPLNEIEHSYMSNIVAIFPSNYEILLLGHNYIFMYDTKTHKTTRKITENFEYQIEKAIEYNGKIISFTKNAPILCMSFNKTPFKILEKQYIQTSFSTDFILNSCALSYFE